MPFQYPLHRYPFHRFTLLGATATFLVVGCAAPTPADDTTAPEAASPSSKPEPPPPSKADFGGATPIIIEPGSLWSGTTDAPDEHAPGLSTASSGESFACWVPLQTGQSYYVYLATDPSDTIDVRTFPTGSQGDVDVHLYRGDGSWVAGSSRGSDYVDRVTRQTSPSACETWIVRFYCYAGPCGFNSWVARGDARRLATGSLYLNQRTFNQVSGRCTLDGKTYTVDGQCMCADASAAMAAVAGGRTGVSNLANAAWDFYVNTNLPGGAASADALMARLQNTYGYAACTHAWVNLESAVVSGIRSGALVLLRSRSFSTAGHYVQVRGYDKTTGSTRVLVNDPYGAWVSKNVWSPYNTPTAGYGDGRWYTLSALLTDTPSVITCQ